MHVRALFLLIYVGCVGCSSAESAPSEPAPTPEVLIGLPSGDDGLDFAPLDPDTPLMLETFFQGGTHVTLAIRCIGLGNSAFVRVTAKNLTTGTEVVSATPVLRPRPLICRDTWTCDLVPFLTMMSGLTEAGESMDGLAIELKAEAKNEAGLEVSSVEPAELSSAGLE